MDPITTEQVQKYIGDITQIATATVDLFGLTQWEDRVAQVVAIANNPKILPIEVDLLNALREWKKPDWASLLLKFLALGGV